MNIQIEKLLFNRRNRNETYSCNFAIGKINIISGNNSRGKTSIIKAADYALCSKTCSIDNEIRRATDFVGIILRINEDRHLFARQIPYETDNGKLCYHLALNGTDDGFVPANFTREIGISYTSMLAVINRLIGADVAEELSAAGKTKHLSIRSLLDVVTQEYAVISNEEKLFRSTAGTFTDSILKTWLPFVIGINTPQGMRARIEHDDADAKYKKLLHELTNARKLSSRWMAEIDTEIENCRTLGLLGENDRFPDGIEGQLQSFERIRRNANRFFAAPLNTSIQDESATELAQLEQEQQDLSLELQSVQVQVDLLERCNRQVMETTAEARQLEGRLKLAEWLAEVWKDDRHTPLFATILGKTGEELTNELDKLSGALRDYQSTLTNRRNQTTYRLAVDRELNALRAKRSQLEKKYRETTDKINARAGEDAQTRELLDAQRAAYVQIGRIEKMTTLAHALIGRDADDNELETLKAQANAAATQVAEEELAEKSRGIDFATKINETLTARAKELDITPDMQNAHAEFDISKLDIKLKYPTREVWLSERGSSSCHIAYHIAITAALEETLAGRPESPLPSYVFYDQPTQSKNDRPALALDRVFSVLEKSLAASKKKNDKGWQPIVIDRIDSERLQNLDTEKYHLVENLDEHDGLLPTEWLGE